MKLFCVFLFLVCFTVDLSAQPETRRFFFPKVGWTISLPDEFQVLDSASNATKNQQGKKAIEDATDIQADLSQTETLISAVKGPFNYFNATITPYNESVDGNWAESNQLVKNVVYQTFVKKIALDRIDSSSSRVMVGGLEFDQFRITVFIDGEEAFTSLLLSRLHNGYDFGITYLYVDADTKKQIEAMLRQSKFKEP